MTKVILKLPFYLQEKFVLRGGGFLARLNISGENSLAKGFLDKNFISLDKGIMTRIFFSAINFGMVFS